MRPEVGVCAIFKCYVSIHAPVKGATKQMRLLQFLTLGFNPRTREGCDPGSVEIYNLYIVSIHAPVKGATVLPVHWNLQPGVSIHAPVKGATFTVFHALIVPGVSIHAPVKGATDWLALAADDDSPFQSTHP